MIARMLTGNQAIPTPQKAAKIEKPTIGRIRDDLLDVVLIRNAD
jgi:hypothetical protein